MVSAYGRFVISYNGEVYNYQPIAAELAASGHKFRGHSDTEVMLEAVAVNGIEPTLKRLVGMFAIALWDRRERTLTSCATGSASSRSIGRSSAICFCSARS